MTQTMNAAPVGTLQTLKNGLFSGELRLDQLPQDLTQATIEVFAHGIALARHKISLAGVARGPFAVSFPLADFPQVSLPVALRARLVETDQLIACDIELSDLESVWAQLMPFKVTVEEIRYDSLKLRIEGTPAELPQFELFDWGVSIAESQPFAAASSSEAAEETAPQVSYAKIALPRSVLDGRGHQLSVIHLQSGFPVTSRPISLSFEAQHEVDNPVAGLLERVAKLETQLARRRADEFRTVLAPLYAHIDTMILNQRSNFEREIAAMRQLLDLPNTDHVEELPSEVKIDFGDPIEGFGFHNVIRTTSNKSIRYISPESGYLVPGVASDFKVKIHLQGLNRKSPQAMAGATLLLNGRRLPTVLYLNPTSESWNVSAVAPAALLRGDHNLVELSLPAARSELHDPHAMPAAVLHLLMTAIAAEKSEIPVAAGG